MPLNGKSAKAKGREGENRLKQELRQSKIDKDAYRVAGSGAGLDKGDVYSPRTGISFEVKHTKNVGISAWRQAKREAGQNHTTPALLWWPHAQPFESSVCLIRWADLKEILKLAYRNE